ncbi:MAG: hypothetical protein IK015_02825 [Treponema sp.]|nr:hypothetical protein [Treponema sp.]
MGVFGKRDLVKLSFFHKIFKTLPKRNFIIELQNLLDDNSNDLTAVSKDMISELKEKYKISSKDFEREREYFLKQYIQHCLYDKRLSDNEKKQLEHLNDLLDLDRNLLWKQIREEGQVIYRDKMRAVIDDDKISDSEQLELDSLQKEFNLSDSDCVQIRSSEVQDKVQQFVNQLVSKRRMSPDDEKQLKEMIAGMKVNAVFSDDGLERFKKLWKIENGELDSISSPITLQKNENLFYSTHVEWYEERTKTRYVSYAGPTINYKIMKGLSLRAGRIAPIRYAEECIKLIDSGTAFFTNKRIIFTGTHGNKTILLSNILDITPFSDGIEIGKNSGKKPFFKCSDPELTGIFIARLLRDC